MTFTINQLILDRLIWLFLLYMSGNYFNSGVKADIEYRILIGIYAHKQNLRMSLSTLLLVFLQL